MSRLLLCSLCVVGLLNLSASADHIWINEFHYDNDGGDVGEFVEVAIRTPNGSGETAASYALEFYNGNNGDLYDTSGTLNTFSSINSFPSMGGSTVTLYSENIPGIQNGAPDGIALVDVVNNTVVSFLSYEGSFSADNDAGGIAGAAGAASTDIGAFEPGNAPAGSSLSLVGIGDRAADFTWAYLPGGATPGQLNAGQALPEPGSILLTLIAAGLTFVVRRRAH